MRRRILNPRHHAYPEYGGRGIALQESWLEFANFLADMGPRPEGTTLDRIDNDGPYTAENCRWATQSQQLLNRRNTVMLTHAGVTRPLREWADLVGVPYQRLWSRVFRFGWSTDRALQT